MGKISSSGQSQGKQHLPSNLAGRDSLLEQTVVPKPKEIPVKAVPMKRNPSQSSFNENFGESYAVQRNDFEKTLPTVPVSILIEERKWRRVKVLKHLPDIRERDGAIPWKIFVKECSKGFDRTIYWSETAKQCAYSSWMAKLYLSHGIIVWLHIYLWWRSDCERTPNSTRRTTNMLLCSSCSDGGNNPHFSIRRKRTEKNDTPCSILIWFETRTGLRLGILANHQSCDHIIWFDANRLCGKSCQKKSASYNSWDSSRNRTDWGQRGSSRDLERKLRCNYWRRCHSQREDLDEVETRYWSWDI